MSGREAILNHLKKNKSITSMEAFKFFGVTRLSACIFDLRAKGHNIDTLMLEGTTRFGKPCKYAKYVYKGESTE